MKGKKIKEKYQKQKNAKEKIIKEKCQKPFKKKIIIFNIIDQL